MNPVKNSNQNSGIHDFEHLNLDVINKPRQNTHMKGMGYTQQHLMNDFVKSVNGIEVEMNN